MPLWGPASLVIITNLLTHRLLHPFFWLDPAEPWNHGRGLNPSVDGWKVQGKLIKFDVPVIRSWLPLQVPLISSLCESLGKTWHQKKHKGLSKPRSPGLTMPAPGWTHTWFEQRPGGSSDSLPRRSLLPADCGSPSITFQGQSLTALGTTMWKHSQLLHQSQLCLLLKKQLPECLLKKQLPECKLPKG